MKVFVEDKIGGLEKFFPPEAPRPPLAGDPPLEGKYSKDPIEVRVEIGKPSKHHRSGKVFYAEANLKMGGKLLRATCQHEDLRNAIVEVKDELQRQIKKFKGKNNPSIHR